MRGSRSGAAHLPPTDEGRRLGLSFSGAKAPFAVAFLATALAGPAAAGDWELKVCADPDNLPFSNKAGEGFDNKIAEILAADLNADLTYVWLPDLRGRTRQRLRPSRRMRPGDGGARWAARLSDQLRLLSNRLCLRLSGDRRASPSPRSTIPCCTTCAWACRAERRSCRRALRWGTAASSPTRSTSPTGATRARVTCRCSKGSAPARSISRSPGGRRPAPSRKTWAA